MRYNPETPLQGSWKWILLSVFVGGLILICLGFWYRRVVQRYSKSPFALKMLSFSIGYGVCQVLTAVGLALG
jgi:hypothetical protein